MREVRLAATFLASLGLGACASVGAPRHSVQRGAEFDAAKVATVTKWAERRGATVVWIHYPTKPRSGDNGGD